MTLDRMQNHKSYLSSVPFYCSFLFAGYWLLDTGSTSEGACTMRDTGDTVVMAYDASFNGSGDDGVYCIRINGNLFGNNEDRFYVRVVFHANCQAE